MERELLEQRLIDWVTHHEKNGIKQHDDRWKSEKVYTIGGSSIATIMGLNPFSTIPKMVSEKIGLTEFVGDIKPQWGNLFEDVIKRHVEMEKNCLILGEDLFIKGPHPCTSYSPDGLTVMDVVNKVIVEVEKTIDTSSGSQLSIELHGKETTSTEIVLVEFKCPYSRLPSGAPPKYYTPQVKMGLQLLDLPTTGLYIEGVFRRCLWADLGNTPEFDKTLVPKKLGDLPKSFGIIGFYIDPNKEIPEGLVETYDAFISSYTGYYIEIGNASNGWLNNDLGECPPELFTCLMKLYDKGVIEPWYGRVLTDDNDISDPDLFSEFCARGNYTNVGILPWKLFHIDYHFIKKEQGFIDAWLPKIAEVIDVVKECLNAPAEVKIRRYNEYVNKLANDRFH